MRLAADLLREPLENPEPAIATLGPSIEQAALHDAAPETLEVATD